MADLEVAHARAQLWILVELKATFHCSLNAEAIDDMTRTCGEG